MKNVFFSFLFYLCLLPLKLRGGHRLRRDKDKICEIMSMPYFSTEGVPEFSTKACAAMLLSHLLGEAVSFRKLMIQVNLKTDNPVDFSRTFASFGVDGFAWKRFEDLEEIKRLIEQGFPVILEGFFDTHRGRVETNSMLIFGYCQWGFLVHDPVGCWSGRPEKGYFQLTSENIFCGKNNLILYRSLRELFTKQGLITLAWAIDPSLQEKEFLNTF